MEVFDFAKNMEREGEKLYQSMAEQLGEGGLATICQMLETIHQLVSRPIPGNWLENAEWYHLEAY